MIHNQLTDIPEEIFTIQALKLVDFTGNSIKFIPERICEAVNLVEINFTANKLVTVPLQLSSLTKLENLFLSSNSIEEIPSGVSFDSFRAALHFSDLSCATCPSSKASTFPKTNSDQSKDPSKRRCSRT